MAPFEFHVSRRARDDHGFDEALFSTNGRVIFADFRAARVFAEKINARRPPERAVRPGLINALGLIDEFLHEAVRLYREQTNPRVMEDALEWLEARSGAGAVEATLLRFVDEFPPVAVYRKLLTPEAWLSGSTAGRSHRPAALEEMILLRTANLNPASAPFRELFDDEPLERETAYLRIISDAARFFAGQPPAGKGGESLMDLLRAPALAAPDSLEAQLLFIRRRWGFILGPAVDRVLRGLDFLREEDKPSFTGSGPSMLPVFGPGSVVASLGLFGPAGWGEAGEEGERPSDPEPERFSPDLDWMPHLVLIAKNVHVWLDQLSKAYGRRIDRLDAIPDEELETLRRRGITGLWLIGVWERSRASRRIKQWMGNPEAAASAYSLHDYAIAADLGGEEALRDLSARAGARGLRLASDMVPNHMGIDSRWVIEHPERFLSLDRPPFPAYAFNGPDLSEDDRVSIRIEDRYYDQADAAVVFERTDRRTGETRYVYHGNDGSSFPWNDTAQLDYSKAEVREAVIRTILDVARRFPVIRFDAAMTLARRHFQRLWFPEPGKGGAIPSRAERGLTRREFDRAIPGEFWREVVDRVATEAPGTLLLAEAFWLMEGYFVRTLGMHRVYNSAFMNMLRDEDNAKYLRVMKNTLEFDPEVLGRFVNFMNNPDERTAVEQFGDGDKYFGVCLLLATLPGLPMVGHGQIEGFSEKYGMEYRRAYREETPDPRLVERHEREIFPLFRKRRLFAGMEHFLLYDPFREDGRVDENVFAFSNGRGDERVLVVFHNAFAETRVRIRISAAFAMKAGEGGDPALIRKDIREGLGLSGDPESWVIFKDEISGLEFIQEGRALCGQGLDLNLRAYDRRVYTAFREVRDDGSGTFARLARELKGGGVPSIEAAAGEVGWRLVRAPFREIAHPGFWRWLRESLPPGSGGTRGAGDETRLAKAGGEVLDKARRLILGMKDIPGLKVVPDAGTAVPAAMRRDFEAVRLLPLLEERFPRPRSRKYRTAVRYLLSPLGAGADGETAPRPSRAKPLERVPAPDMDERTAWMELFAWAAIRSLGRARRKARFAAASRSFYEEWGFGDIVAGALVEAGADSPAAREAALSAGILSGPRPRFRSRGQAAGRALRLVRSLFADEAVRKVLGVNEYAGKVYFNKEAFERLAWRLAAAAALDAVADPRRTPASVTNAVMAFHDIVRALLDAAGASGFLVEGLIRSLEERKGRGCRSRS